MFGSLLTACSLLCCHFSVYPNCKVVLCLIIFLSEWPQELVASGAAWSGRSVVGGGQFFSFFVSPLSLRSPTTSAEFLRDRDVHD